MREFENHCRASDSPTHLLRIIITMNPTRQEATRSRESASLSRRFLDNIDHVIGSGGRRMRGDNETVISQLVRDIKSRPSPPRIVRLHHDEFN